jgi:phosphoribosyl-ATP pyrophosphohydrolase
MSDAIQRLYDQILSVRAQAPTESRTAKLLQEGVGKMAKKVAEEAVEVSLEAVTQNREALLLESADLVYNLTALWAGLGVTPDEVWREMERREQLYGIAEKLAKVRPGAAGEGAPGAPVPGASPLDDDEPPSEPTL